MPPSDLVSVVIPCYNPSPLVEETIASVQRQTHQDWEIIVVDDGTDQPAARAILENIEQRGVPRLRVLHQENRGLAGARNSGFQAAQGRYVIPLDADDLLEPEMMAVCLAEMGVHTGAGFAYFDYHVFGDSNYIERPGEYNLYRLLDENFMAYCCFVPRQVWAETGGYDGWHRWGYEDWSFFLNLGKHGYQGHYIRQPLFRYRTHGRGLHYTGLDRHDSNWAHMREAHPELLSREGRLRVKKQWAPAICFVVQGGQAPDLDSQTVRDFQLLLNVDERTALGQSPAEAFLWLSGSRPLRPQAAEECIWGLTAADWVSWDDTGDAPPPSLQHCAGPLGISRRAMGWPEPKESGEVRRLPWRCSTGEKPVASPGAARRAGARRHGTGERAAPGRDHDSIGSHTRVDSSRQAPPSGQAAPSLLPWVERLYHHLQNAEVLSAEAWLKHPLRSAARLVPLRLKEKVNRVARRPLFDLRFYLKFQPRSVLLAGELVERLDYIPPAPSAGRRRVALCTPHLGVGGAEKVLLEVARQIDRSDWDILLVATHSQDRRWLSKWNQCVDYVYDLAPLVVIEQSPKFLLSLALNWDVDLLIIQNSAPAYSILPAFKERRPSTQVIDILHAVDEDWDFFSATLEVADYLDRRVVISEAGRHRLAEMAIPEDRIRLIPNGVDLARFDPLRLEQGQLRRRLGLSPATHIILFIGRLDAIKRPLLLPEIARELERLPGRAAKDFHFVVAGDGPEGERLRSLVQSRGLRKRFSLLGHVQDVAELLADAAVLVIPSEGEGIPLVLLEALAMETPVVACRSGAIAEALPPTSGILVEPGLYEETRLAQALEELLEDHARRAEMGRAGRALVKQQFSLERARRQYRELIEQLTRPGARAGQA